MSAAHPERLAGLRSELAQVGLDGLVVSSPSSIFYLSGFRGSTGVLLVTAERAVLLSDSRYRLQAKEQARDCEFVEVEQRLMSRAGQVGKEAGVRRLGYDPAHLTCQRKEELGTGSEGMELTPAAGLVEKLRAVKSPQEIDCIRSAAALADQGMAHMTSLLRPGTRERDVALQGEFTMRRLGAEAAPFDVIVASGPRSALPHADSSTRELEEGDLVVVDLGARVDGYCSDMTRTFAVKRAFPRAEEIYAVVYQAQRAGAAAVRAGAICSAVDRVARSIVTEAGYGDCFGHGLGHGVGVEVHEAPRLGKDEPTELVPGNVVTVEPGVYLSEVGGVRLEDLLVVTPHGSETLNGSALSPELPVV